MEIIWDYNRFRLVLNACVVQLAPENLPPFQINAVIEEQDTALILSPAKKIVLADPRPAWYLSNMLEYQKLLQPGDVIERPGSPTRLLAIVHDFDVTPSQKSAWIKLALDNVFIKCKEGRIQAIKLPILGSVYGLLVTKTLHPCCFQPSAIMNLTQKSGWLYLPVK